jgi:hypothetical protein
VLAKSPMAAARRSIGGPVPRKNEPIATTSGKSLRRSEGHNDRALVPIRARSRPFPVPHTRGRDRFAAKRKRKGRLPKGTFPDAI